MSSKIIGNRIQNIEYLITCVYGTQSAMAVELEGTGFTQSYISNLLYSKSPFYDLKARAIERKLGIPQGWLDQDEWVAKGISLVKGYRIMNDNEKLLFNKTVTFIQSRHGGQSVHKRL